METYKELQDKYGRSVVVPADSIFGSPILMSANSGYARWIKDVTYAQKGTGYQAELYGGAQSGDDWAACYIPVKDLKLVDFESAYWSWYQTNTETMGLGIVIWVHDPTDYDKRAEITQLGGTALLDKASGWNSHEFNLGTTQMFYYGENVTESDGTATGLTAGTQYTLKQFQQDNVFENWVIYRISFDYGWEASGTFESVYLTEVKINGENILLVPSEAELSFSLGSGWKAATVADEASVSSEVDLGSAYKYATVLNPTIDAAYMSVQGAMNLGGTYYPIYAWEDNDADGTVLLATTAETTSKAVTYFIGGFRFVKVAFSAAQNGGPYTLYVRGFN